MEQLKGRRLIALDRPGFGLSDPVLGAKLGAIRCGLVWTAVDTHGIEGLSFRGVWTAVDAGGRRL